MDIDLIERLERRLEEDLPGRVAQLEMAPLGRIDQLEPRPDHKEAGVMILIFPRNEAWMVALIERTAVNPNDPHSGQISLPGGKYEEMDGTLHDCALRETQEEIGIDMSDIGVVGELSTLYVPVSNFLIYPFVGFMSHEPDFDPQASEVQQVIEVDLEVFIEDKYRRKTDIAVREMVLKDVPYYKVGGKKLWGATAMIMSEFGAILKDVY